jgi:methylmalonyl-CoA/ethylmalonyl-CoA epimerase
MKIDHFGIAVRSLDESLPFYRNVLGLELAGRHAVEDQGVTVALLPVGDSRVELLEPASADSPVGRFIGKRGEGLHHICYQVENLETALAQMKTAGIRLLDGYPRLGAEGKPVAFLHPASANGVLVELIEKPRTREGEL